MACERKCFKGCEYARTVFDVIPSSQPGMNMRGSKQIQGAYRCMQDFGEGQFIFSKPGIPCNQGQK